MGWGIRVPCIISWPGQIASGQVRDQMACSIDLFPTIVNYCQAKLPKRKLDGRDISEIIDSENASSPHDILYWMKGKNWAVRKGQWKLVYDSDESFLSNMQINVTETKNLASDNEDIVQELTDLHQEWVEEVIEQ